MRLTIVPLTCLALFVLASPVMAKEKKPAKEMDPQAMMEVWKKLSMPGEPHKLFASLAGSWTTTTKEWMEPGKPPSESSGTAEMKMLLDGRFLYQEYNAQMMGQPFSGVGIDAYDNMTKKYVTAWIDSMGTGIFMMEGTASADGKTLYAVEPGAQGIALIDLGSGQIQMLLRSPASSPSEIGWLGK